MIEVIAAHPGIVLVTLGPLTNVALALARSPEIVGNVSRCVIMGGNPCTEGNVTPAAEYNMWVDPEAARMVLRSGLPVELVGWHLCRGEANLLAPDIEHVLGLGTELARFTIDCNRTAMEANRRQTGEVGIALPDPTAMAIALDPSICTSASRHYVDIETDSELTRGMTVVDRLGCRRRRAESRGVAAAAGPRAECDRLLDNRYSALEEICCTDRSAPLEAIILDVRHLDQLAHFEQPRPCSHPDPLFQEIFAVQVFLQSRAALIASLGIAQVRGDNRRLPIIAAMGNDRRHGVFHPIGHAMRAQIVEHQDLGFERRSIRFRSMVPDAAS